MKAYTAYHLVDRYIGIPLILILHIFNRIFTKKNNAIVRPQKILIVKLAMLGDTILLAPSVRAIRKQFPQSHITMLCSPLNKSIVERWDFIDEYIVFDFTAYVKFPWRCAALLLRLRNMMFDTVLDFETWPRIMPILEYFTGAKTRIGFNVPRQWRHFLFTHVVKHVQKRHEALCFSDIVKASGVSVEDFSMNLPVESHDLDTINRLLIDKGLDNGKQFVIIHPGCGVHGYYRRWQEEKYAQIADYIIEKHNIAVIVTGSRDDAAITAKMISLMKHKAIDLSAQTSLPAIWALIRRSLFVVCGNTGILHMAAAENKRTIAIHGPTDPAKWGPWGKGHIIIRKDIPCSPCSYLGYEFKCKQRQCTEGIVTQNVVAAVDILLKELDNEKFALH